MIGKLDVEEDVMDESVIANRKAAAVMKTVSGKLSDVIATLGWDCYDDVVVEIGGTVVSGIHQGENYNKKMGNTLWCSQVQQRCVYCYQESYTFSI